MPSPSMDQIEYIINTVRNSDLTMFTEDEITDLIHELYFHFIYNKEIIRRKENEK
ncbi:MAG: hypothetical protein WC554_10425 [Clostridia bacterium]|jgi:hypothetical protein|nr:hypothetical protein [Candidatus Nanoarchaeia archaeon]